MHAQIAQRRITWEEVWKVKAFTDMVMHQYYKPIWLKSMEELTRASPPAPAISPE
jgi:hypothetical protein